jgi:hypothetical protein
MVPKDLSGFSVEQLKGFAVAVKQAIVELKAAKDGSFTAVQVDQFEALADDASRIQEAIALGVEGDEAEEAVEEAVAAPVEGEEAPAEGEAADEESDAPADDEAVVDEAVASATMGGGSIPVRVTREAPRSDSGMGKFIQNMVNSGRGVSSEERQSFSTMRRETNHIVQAGRNADEAIRAAQADRASGSDKTAAGCFCGPDDSINTIKESGETTRPISDTLPTITATGNVKYVRQIDLADALTGVTEWTCADQALVDPEEVATWKPCFELDCAAEETSELYAVSACASFSTQQLIGNPTLVDNLQHVMQVAFSKTSELLVYNRLRALSSQYLFGYDVGSYGASAQLLAAVGWAMENIRASLRESNPNYTLALPAGLIERVLTDGVIRATDDYRTRDDIFERLATLGVSNVVELVDEITGVPSPLAHTPLAAPGGPRVAAPDQPLAQEILLYRPEDFILGVGPDIDLGVTRSPELARQNKLQWFTEGFEFVEKVGTAPAVDLVVDFCANGARPAFAIAEACAVE